MMQSAPTRGSKTEGIDWHAVREKLARASSVARPSPERTREILEGRARKLAQQPAEVRDIGTTLDILTFTLANERYGLEAHYVREVLRFTEFTPVPGVPEFIIGVTNLRGEIVPVVDLRLFFALPSKGLTDRSRVVICGRTAIEFGIVADSVENVARLPVADLLADSVFEGECGQDCVRGIARDALIVLDGSALLSDRRLFIDEPGSKEPIPAKRRT